MASGFQGGGDFYSSAGNGNGGGGRSAVIDNAPVQYRSQLGGILVDSSSAAAPMIPPRRTDLLSKRSLAELQQQQQQQQQQAYLMRMVKQRTAQLQNRTSPISPLSPVDSEISASIRYGYGGQGLGNGYRFSIPLVRPPQMINPNNNIQSSYLSQPSLSNLSFSTNNSLQNRQQQPVAVLEEPKASDSEKKMRDRLQELEKQLLEEDDDDNNEAEDEGDAASVITGNEWTETMQNLLSPSPNQQKSLLSPSPTSSSSSSSSSSTSQLNLSSSSKQTLIDAATAISEGNFEAAMLNLERLKPISNTRGDPEHRLTAYMVSALRSRIDPEENPPSVTEFSTTDEIIASQILYEVSPCFKLGFMAANLAILESIKDQPPYNLLHVVDFDIGQGIQYATLIQALAERKTSAIKITTVTDPSKGNEDGLRTVGDRLRKLAGRVGIGLKFNIVSKKISDLILNREVLCIDSDESLAVNFAFHLHNLPDESVSTENPRDELLRFVKSLKPKVVTLVEQEMNCNTAPFVARLTESCVYYRALFDSIDSAMGRDSIERVRVEEWLAKKATNSVACEGRERVERCEVFGKWRARMGMAGLRLTPLSQNVGESLKARLSLISENNPGITIKEESGGISFGWMGRVLTVASAWQ